MSPCQKEPLRPLSPEGRRQLPRVSRAQAESAAVVARAKAVRAVADGQSFTAAARTAGRRSGDAVAHLVRRFNQQGRAARVPRQGGGQPKRYTSVEQERILREVRRQPDRRIAGTATWSLTTLQRAGRWAPGGLPTGSTCTLWRILRDAGFRWGRARGWCATGTAIRKRKSGTVTVHAPDAVAKKLDRGRRPPGRPAGLDRGRSRTRPDRPLPRPPVMSASRGGASPPTPSSLPGSQRDWKRSSPRCPRRRRSAIRPRIVERGNAGRRDGPSASPCRRSCLRGGCCACGTVSRGIGRLRWCSGSSPPGSCPSTRRWEAGG
jgi:transposase